VSTNPPKVFICHASEDKERFVLDFASRLLGKGVDVWLDKWEMYPGDSLVGKIFEEGIKNAQAMIVVLSKYSVNKPWVREELNTAVVKRIEDNTKLIPVLIDDCYVPESLRATVWVRIDDVSNYGEQLDRIVMSIFGVSEKPNLGAPPRYAITPIDNIPGLNSTDSLIFKLACEKTMELGYFDAFVNIDSMSEQIISLEIPTEEFLESLEILDQRGYLKANRIMRRTEITGGNIKSVSITLYGFDEYVRTCVDNYDSIVKGVMSQLVNLKKRDAKEIAKELDKPFILIGHILHVLKSKGLITLAESFSGDISILDISIELKRLLQS
jgi:hypothetical protein